MANTKTKCWVASTGLKPIADPDAHRLMIETTDDHRDVYVSIDGHVPTKVNAQSLIDAVKACSCNRPE
jgi:hypothetical protein